MSRHALYPSLDGIGEHRKQNPWVHRQQQKYRPMKNTIHKSRVIRDAAAPTNAKIARPPAYELYCNDMSPVSPTRAASAFE